MSVLREYHAALGDLVFRFEGTLERSPATGSWCSSTTRFHVPTRPLRSVRMGVAMQNRVAELAEGWRRSGHDLGFSVGIAQGSNT